MRPDDFAAAVANDIAAALGDGLVGVYLHGSLAFGCFNPSRSDVDLLVVTETPPPEGSLQALAAALRCRSGSPFDIELSVLSRADLDPWRHPAPYAFHFGGTVVGTPTAPDPDLAAHVAVTRSRGVCLLGREIESTLPPVPESDVRDSIRRDLESVLGEADGVYAVLNACRAAAYGSTGELLSKVEGAVWALDRAPSEHVRVIEAALTAYRGGSDEPCAASDVARIVRWALAQVRG